MRRFTALDAESRKAAVGLPRSYDKALKDWLRTTVNNFSAVGSSTLRHLSCENHSIHTYTPLSLTLSVGEHRMQKFCDQQYAPLDPRFRMEFPVSKLLAGCVAPCSYHNNAPLKCFARFVPSSKPIPLQKRFCTQARPLLFCPEV